MAMKVWNPFTGYSSVELITSNAEHVGNLVAEGLVSKESYWRLLCELEREGRLRAEARLAKVQSEIMAIRARHPTFRAAEELARMEKNKGDA